MEPMSKPGQSKDTSSPTKRQNIRRLMSGLWSVFAALLLKEFITAGYGLVKTGPSFAAYAALAAVSIFVWKQVMDCYIYFSHFDEYPLPRGPKPLQIFHIFVDNVVEFGIMIALVVLIHQIPNTETQISNTAAQTPNTAAQIRDLVSATWWVALAIEFLWLLWDISYAVKYVEAEMAKQPFKTIVLSLWNSQKQQEKQFRKWLVLNALWVIVFFLLSMLTKSYFPEARFAALILLVGMFCFACVYIVTMDDYFLAVPESLDATDRESGGHGGQEHVGPDFTRADAVRSLLTQALDQIEGPRAPTKPGGR
ncbi:MAG TPA: hypothetical protein VK601_01875 [Kofleriaceae bacterium]|nr:hypothetical protein [Kofleriaceae bacterium]